MPGPCRRAAHVRSSAPRDAPRAQGLVVAGLIFVGSAVGSAVVGYYVQMGLDAMHEALADDGEEEEAEEEPESRSAPVKGRARGNESSYLSRGRCLSSRLVVVIVFA